MHGTRKIKCGSLFGISVWCTSSFQLSCMQTSFYIWKAFLAVNSSLRIQMPPRTPFTWHLMIISKVKVVIHDIIFVFRARTAISFTLPLSCGKYLPSVLLNIMMICVNVHRSSLTKNVMIFFKQVWEETTTCIDFCEYFCAVHKRLGLY